MFVKMKDTYAYHGRRNVHMQRTGREIAPGFGEGCIIKSA